MRFLGSLFLALAVLAVLTCDMEATGLRNRQQVVQKTVVRQTVTQQVVRQRQNVRQVNVRQVNVRQLNFHHQNFQQQNIQYQQNVQHGHSFLRRDLVGNRLNTFTSYNLAVPATVQYSYYQAPVVQPVYVQPVQQQLYLQQQTGCVCDSGGGAVGDTAYLQTGTLRGAAVTRSAAYVTLPTAFITSRRVLLSDCH